jgi:HPt (histidine-containing phosphotransfer) domain-containing protein
VNEPPALDPGSVDSLRAMVGDDPEALGEVVQAFVDDSPTSVRALREGIAASDSELVRRAAHTLKGNAATFGALELADACRELEHLARDGGLDGAEALAGRIEVALAGSLPSIRALAG